MTTTARRLAGFDGLGGRARWAMVALGAMVVIDLLAVGSDFLEWRLIAGAEGGVLTVADAEANDTRQAVMGFLQFAGYVAGAILFLRWFRRAYLNLPALGAE